MAATLHVQPGLELPLEEIVLRASRSSGPGGQHANVTASRIEAVFDVRSSRALTDEQRERLLERAGPVVRAVAQDERSQLANRDLALERLAGRLRSALAVRPERRSTRPTGGARRRRLEDKARQAERKRGRRQPGADE